MQETHNEQTIESIHVAFNNFLISSPVLCTQETISNALFCQGNGTYKDYHWMDPQIVTAVLFLFVLFASVPQSF